MRHSMRPLASRKSSSRLAQKLGPNQVRVSSVGRGSTGAKAAATAA